MSVPGISNIHCKVESTAKLFGVTGSIAVRKEVAKGFRSDFSKMLIDTFEQKDKAGQKSIVTLEEIKGFFKKLAPDLDLKIRATFSNPDNGNVKRVLSDSKKSVKGYLMEIPFEMGDTGAFIRKSDSTRLDILDHEKTHLSELITEPKYIARIDLTTLPKEIKNKGWDFYEKIIYNDEVNNSSNLDATDRLKKHIIEDKRARINSVQVKIRNFFDDNYFSPSEKIDLLQTWRHNIKTELVAHNEEFINSTSKEIITNTIKKYLKCGKEIAEDMTDAFGEVISIDTKRHASLDGKINEIYKAFNKGGLSTYSATIDQQYFMPEKLDLIEKMLVEEIGGQRAKYKKRFG